VNDFQRVKNKKKEKKLDAMLGSVNLIEPSIGNSL